MRLGRQARSQNCGVLQAARSNQMQQEAATVRASEGPYAKKNKTPASPLAGSDTVDLQKASGSLRHLSGLFEQTERRASEQFLQKRSEEHTSELQSLTNLVCRLLLEKK